MPTFNFVSFFDTNIKIRQGLQIIFLFSDHPETFSIFPPRTEKMFVSAQMAQFIIKSARFHPKVDNALIPSPSVRV